MTNNPKFAQNFGFNNQTNNMYEADRLRSLLYHCTYSDDTKYIIEREVRKVLGNYSMFQVEILEFAESGQQKRFLEIKGILEVEVKGKNCKVDFNVMLPNGFPHKPPYVRIINKNAEYTVDSFYKNLRSPNDPKSFILNGKLEEIKKWNSSSSIMNLVIESKNMLRTNFPFSKPSSTNNSGINSGWAKINEQNNGNSWQSQQNNQYNKSQGFNNYPNQNQGSTQSQGFQNFNSKPTPPIPFNTNNLTQLIANGQKVSGEGKKIMEKLRDEHLKAVQKVQQLETFKYSLDSESLYLQNENAKILRFIKKSENSDLKDLATLIKPKDDRSEQILELNSSIKAREDCITLLEERFNDEKITFDELIKYVRRCEEEKFEEKVLLTKCIQ